jgi:predicted dehydrogenase
MVTVDPNSHGAVEHAGEEGFVRPDLFYDHEIGGTPRGAFVDAVGHFVDCVRQGERPQVTAQDGIENTEIVLAALSSAEQGGVPIGIGKGAIKG